MSISEKVEDKFFEAAYQRFKKLKRWQKTAIKWLIGLAVVCYLLIRYIVPPIQDWWTSRVLPFPEGVAGILVLRIEGDDEKNSLQRDLVSTLNTELSKEAPEQKVEVHAYNQIVTETKGLSEPEAHAMAREIGKKCKALLVIWGDRIEKRKFHPRFTVVENFPPVISSGEFSLAAKEITELSVPPELIEKPVYLTHFVAGYIFYNRKDYATALAHFQTALNQSATNALELNGIRFYAGFCHWNLAQGQKNMVWHLQQASTLYIAALIFFNEKEFPVQWALIQNNLSNAYRKLNTVDRKEENLQMAISACKAALRVFTKKNFPAAWAMTQCNLGAAYSQLSLGDYSANLQTTITAYDSSLRIYTEKDFSREWATVQNNLGNAYLRLPSGDRNENLQKAIAAYEAAQRVRTEKDSLDWAATQHNLGNTYLALTVGDRSKNIQKAISSFEAAFRVYTEKNFPWDWAMVQNAMGLAYKNLPTGDRKENLQKAIICFENALKIWTAENFPNDYQMVTRNLKNAQNQLKNLANK